MAKITIVLKEDDGALTFFVQNTKPTETSTFQNLSDDALGLANVKKQLELLYPKTHELTINDTNALYEVQLKIPAHGI